MNIYGLMSVLCLTVALVLGIVVYHLDAKSPSNRLYLLLALWVAYEAVLDLGYRQAHDLAEAMTWWRLDVLWPLGPALMVHFIATVTGIRDRVRTPVVIALYLPGVVISLLILFTDQVTQGPVLHAWGWECGMVEGGWVIGGVSAWIVLCFLTSIGMALRGWRRADTSSYGRQMRFLVTGIALTLVAVLFQLTEFWTRLELPQWTIAAFLIFNCFVAWGIRSHSLFRVTPVSASSSILATMTDAVFLADEVGRVRFANAAAERLLGRPLGGIRDQRLTAIVSSGSQASTMEELWCQWAGEVSDRHQIVDREAVLSAASDPALPVSLAGERLQDLTGDLVGYLVIARDIRERKAAEVQLEQQNRALEHANSELERIHREKDQFFAMVSHELRTPLVTGLGYIDLLLTSRLGPISDAIHDEMSAARRHLAHLSRLIERLLVFYRLSRRDKPFQPSWSAVDIEATVLECVDETLMMTDMPEDRIEYHIEDHLPRVRSNPDLLRNLLNNLMDNAIRYAGDGARIRVAAQRGAPGSVRITVEDDGIGLPFGFLSETDAPFIHRDGSNQLVGLGLAIVRAIIEAHGATVYLRSEPNNGTRCSFDLPVWRSPPIDASHTAT